MFRKVTGTRRVLLWVVLTLMVVLSAVAFAADGEEYSSPMFGTFWSLVPPIVAITLALISKEVYSSLFLGILMGALLYSSFNLELAFNTLLQDGFIANLSDSWNVGILIFLVILGVFVVLMNRAGGSAAYGRWARQKIKDKQGATLATFFLGVLIFVDDYFNCLTVGSVMRPVTDNFGVSRAKLSYIIDATAAPICMIAPISSWAAAVTGVVEGVDGLDLFIRAIPYNFYSLLTILMVIALSLMKFDYGPMKVHEKNAENGDLFTTDARPYGEAKDEDIFNPKGRIIDLVLPMIVLIVSCVLGMVYTGGFFSGESFVNAFANCDASVGLALGSLIALLISCVYFICRRVLSFKEVASSIPEGFKTMVPAILILCMAWGIKSMTGLLGADVYVAGLVEKSAGGLAAFLPAIIFVVALGLSFATGTSWGTFGVLLPIVVACIEPGSTLLIISVSACLAGAVCGDHCSPISDTTIMASTGGQCDHVVHVATQLPYALTVAAVSFVSYIIAGFIQNIAALPIALVLMFATLLVIKKVTSKKAA